MKDRAISDDVLAAEYEALYHYALSLCRNTHEAQDITQDTFMKAMRSPESFKGDSSLYTWLCSIAKNTWLDRCKAAKREVSADGWEETMPDDGVSVEERAADHDTALAVHRALHTLDEPYKEVFSLRVFGQLSFREISALFGKTESWARVTYYRAKKQITEILRKDGTL